MGAFHYMPSQDREYGPGQDDYEYDVARQREVDDGAQQQADDDRRRADEEQFHQQ